jgi:hypothetical protein
MGHFQRVYNDKTIHRIYSLIKNNKNVAVPAHSGPGPLFSFVIIFHRRQDSLDEWSARRKAST